MKREIKKYHIPPRPANVDNTHWEIYKLYMEGDQQAGLAKRFCIPVSRVTTIINDINELTKNASPHELGHGLVTNRWQDHEAHRNSIRQRFLEAKEMAIFEGSNNILIKQPI